MTTTVPFHDYTIESVLIEAKRCRMVIRAFARHAPETPISVAEFTGVAAYHLVGDVLGTIVLSLKEEDAFELYRERAAELQATYDQNGGHGSWVATAEAARAFIDTNAIRGFVLLSSIGAEGAIWCRGFSASTEQVRLG